jgi:hypothetical protein
MFNMLETDKRSTLGHYWATVTFYCVLLLVLTTAIHHEVLQLLSLRMLRENDSSHFGWLLECGKVPGLLQED